MKRWLRFGVIGAASFVLLVTVLPQVASGLGLGSLATRLASSASCSGDIGSSVCGPHGTVTGTVAITGAPSGFKTSAIGVGACPESASGTLACANPSWTFSANKKNYTLELGVGKWRIGGFYELNSLGGAFISPSTVITVSSKSRATRNFSVPYQVPATITGTVQVTGVPSEYQARQLQVVLCPSYAPYKSGFPSLACVTKQAPFDVGGLPPGRWTVDPGFCASSNDDGQYECLTNAAAGESITLAPGGLATLNLATPFLAAGYGMVAGAFSVSGAPKGFSDPVGLEACKKTASSCQFDYVPTGHLFELLLPQGLWHLTSFYLAPPFYNEILGPTRAVEVTSGNGALLDITDPYQVLGKADGTIDVTGAPSQVSFESYTVLACPASSPWTGGFTAPECVNEYSGSANDGGGISVITSPELSKIPHPAVAHLRPADSTAPNSYQLPTLTPGTWLLYPGYQTVFSTYVEKTPTRVAIAAGATNVQNLTIPYQAPTQGVVTGNVSVVGAPANYGVDTGAEGCSAPPTATSCKDAQFAYSDENDGSYQLLLNPGTWWVSGTAQFFAEGFSQAISTPQEVVVQAGVETTEDFTVTAPS